MTAMGQYPEGPEPRKELRSFGTLTADLLTFDWLQRAGCPHVAMESTAFPGAQSPPCSKASARSSWSIRNPCMRYGTQNRGERCRLDGGGAIKGENILRLGATVTGVPQGRATNALLGGHGPAVVAECACGLSDLPQDTA